MRTPHSTLYRYTAETISQANRLPVGSVEESRHKTGMELGEPLIIMMDCLIKYAEAYRERYDFELAQDSTLGASWLDSLEAVKDLLNSEGVLKMKGKVNGESFDGQTMWNLYADAKRIAGFKPEEN